MADVVGIFFVMLPGAFQAVHASDANSVVPLNATDAQACHRNEANDNDDAQKLT